MPNWMNGSLKVRGPLENVKRFFMEGLIEPDDRLLLDDDTYQMTMNLPVPLEVVDFGDMIELNYKSISWPYVDGTKRAFISQWYRTIYITRSENSSDIYIGIAEVNQAWDFRPYDWVELSKKYGVDIRLWGLEGGVGFGHEIEIINGELTLDESTSYDTWTNPLPWIGG